MKPQGTVFKILYGTQKQNILRMSKSVIGVCDSAYRTNISFRFFTLIHKFRLHCISSNLWISPYLLEVNLKSDRLYFVV